MSDEGRSPPPRRPADALRRWLLLFGTAAAAVWGVQAIRTRLPWPPAVQEPATISKQPAAIAYAAALPATEVPPAKKTLHVSTTGSDTAGNGTETAPYRTIAFALSKASAGSHILVHEGTYPEYLKTRTNGTASNPIVLRAIGSVVLTGSASNGRIMNLWHDYYVVEGFEWTGKDILLWLQEADHTVIRKNFFHHARGECVRVKYQSTYNILERNRVEDCGLDDFVNNGGGKNGEGFYLGTAPEQLWKNPTSSTDKTSFNLIRNNTVNTRGNECVDIKEGSEGNVVEFNDYTGQKDPESGGLNSRGNKNIFRYNKTYGNVGAGIRFGGDSSTDGIKNEAYGNEITDNQGYAIKVTRIPQGVICGNAVSGNLLGLSNNGTVQNPPCSFPLQPPGVQPETAALPSLSSCPIMGPASARRGIRRGTACL